MRAVPFTVPEAVSVRLERWGGQPVRGYCQEGEETLLRVAQATGLDVWEYHVESRAERRGVAVLDVHLSDAVRTWRRVLPGQVSVGDAGRPEKDWTRWTIDRRNDGMVRVADAGASGRVRLRMHDEQWTCLLADLHALASGTLWPDLPCTPEGHRLARRPDDGLVEGWHGQRSYRDFDRTVSLVHMPDAHWVRFPGLDEMRLPVDTRSEDLARLRRLEPGRPLVGDHDDVVAGAWTIHWQCPDHVWTDGRIDLYNPHAHRLAIWEPTTITPRTWRTLLADLEEIGRGVAIEDLPPSFAPEPARSPALHSRDLAAQLYRGRVRGPGEARSLA